MFLVRALSISGVIALLAFTACTEPDVPPPLGPAAFTGAVWEDLGEARFGSGDGAAAPEVGVDPPAPATDGAAAPPAAGGEVVMRMVDVANRRMHRVTVPRSGFADAAAEVQRRGLDRGHWPGPAEDRIDGSFSFGWSDDDDGRTRITTTTSWPFRAIGTLLPNGQGCTGTRISSRVVLTAAHCIYDRTDGTWNTIQFRPGRNGINSSPYGSSHAVWYWVPDGYITGAPNLNGYDIAIVVLDHAVGNGWMGYGAWGSSVLDTKAIYMRGYPLCGLTGAPANDCVDYTLWGDQACDLGDYFNLDGDNWNREIMTNCDGSFGQSGSAFYYYTDSNSPAAFGVFSHMRCEGECPANMQQYVDYPNVITRITPEYLDTIHGFVVNNP